MRRNSLRLSPKLRRVVTTLHRVASLVLGLHLALLCLTGSILIYGEDIDTLLHPAWRAAKPTGELVPPERVIQAYHAARPGIAIDRIYAPQGALETYRVRTYPVDEQREAFVDPHTGAFLGERFRDSFFIRQLGHFHISLLKVKFGRNINGVTAAFGLWILLSGVLLWLPGTWGQLRNRLTLSWNGSVRKRVTELHNTVGAWSSLILIFALGSGFLWAFEDFTNIALAAIGGSPRFEERPKVKPTGLPFVPDAQILSLAAARSPGTHLVKYLVPSDKNKIAEVHREWSDNDTYGNKYVLYVDAETGKIVAEHDTRGGSFGTWISKWIRPFHRGLWGGNISRFLYFLAGIAPTILFITGIWKVVLRRRSQTELEERRATTPEEVEEARELTLV